MKKLLKFIIFFISFNFLSPAVAELNIELTQGSNDAIPIAIVPFAHETSNVPGDMTLTQVISHDLKDSGQFNVLTPSLLMPKPTQLSQVQFDYWRQQKMNDLLIGQVKDLGNNRFQVNFKLVALFAESLKALQTDPNSAVLLDQNYTTNQAGLRQLAHHISDLIYQKITGVRGVFSTKIAYILVQHPTEQNVQYRLEIADADGFNPQTLLVSEQPMMSPTWAPNGRQIAYVSFEHKHAAIYLQDIYTGKRELISDFPGINGAPAFSPDGKKLALVLTLTGNPKIYILNLANKKLTQITHGYAIDTEPAWAPDGQSIVFTSNRGGHPQIYRYYFANHQIERVTFEGNYNARAEFTSDGEQLVMMHRETDLFGIAVQNLQTGRMTILTDSGDDESPSVAPNGAMVIYATRHQDRGVLAQVSINGAVKLRLPAQQGSVREPAWSPF